MKISYGRPTTDRVSNTYTCFTFTSSGIPDEYQKELQSQWMLYLRRRTDSKHDRGRGLSQLSGSVSAEEASKFFFR